MVSLPDGRASLQMIRLGCQFLLSWTNFFTKSFIAGRSWNDEFELVDLYLLKATSAQQQNQQDPKKSSSVATDITKFVKEVESILLFSDMQNVVSKRPPYVEACLRILGGLVAPDVT